MTRPTTIGELMTEAPDDLLRRRDVMAVEVLLDEVIVESDALDIALTVVGTVTVFARVRNFGADADYDPDGRIVRWTQDEIDVVDWPDGIRVEGWDALTVWTPDGTRYKFRSPQLDLLRVAVESAVWDHLYDSERLRESLIAEYRRRNAPR